MYEITELRDRQCRYPLTEATPHFFCGEPTARGSYCAAHARICFAGSGKPWQALAGMIDAVEQSVVRQAPGDDDLQPEIDNVFRGAAIDEPGALMRRL